MDQPIQGARGILYYVGLGTPSSRAIVAATAVGLAAYAMGLPTAAFDEESGEMRPLKGLSSAPNATYYHFLAVPVSAAVVAGILI
jgi:hypothetical protein